MATKTKKKKKPGPVPVPTSDYSKAVSVIKSLATHAETFIEGFRNKENLQRYIRNLGKMNGKQYVTKSVGDKIRVIRIA